MISLLEDDAFNDATEENRGLYVQEQVIDRVGHNIWRFFEDGDINKERTSEFNIFTYQNMKLAQKFGKILIGYQVKTGLSIEGFTGNFVAMLLEYEKTK